VPKDTISAGDLLVALDTDIGASMDTA
jgi:hypothetical protein